MFIWNEDGVKRGSKGKVERWAIAPDGHSIALGSASGVPISKIDSGEPQLEAMLAHPGRVFCLGFSDDRALLAIGGYSGRPFISMWELQTKREIGRLIQGQAVNCISISRDSHWLASADLTRRVKLWDLTKLKKSTLLANESWLQPIALSRDDKTIACVGPGQVITLWDTSTGERSQLGLHAGQITNIAFSPDGMAVASASVDRSVKLWDVATRKCIDTLSDLQQEVWSVAFASSDGTKIISGGRAGELWWWDRKTGKKLAMPGHRSDATVCCLKASPDFQFLISGTVWAASNYEERDNEAIVWDLRSGQPVAVGQPILGPVVSSVSFSPDGQYFVLGRATSTVEIRKLTDHALVNALHGEGTWMTGAAFSPDGQYLMTAGASGEIHVFGNWDKLEEEPEATIIRTGDQLRRIEFFQRGNTFVTGGMEGYIRVWRVGELAPQSGK